MALYMFSLYVKGEKGSKGKVGNDRERESWNCKKEGMGRN